MNCIPFRFFLIKSANATAGLKAPPEIAPPQYITAARAKPIGIACPVINITDRKMKVPINSTKYFIISIFFIILYVNKKLCNNFFIIYFFLNINCSNIYLILKYFMSNIIILSFKKLKKIFNIKFDLNIKLNMYLMISLAIVSHYYQGKTVCFPVCKEIKNPIYCNEYAPISYKVLIDLKENKIIKIGKNMNDSSDDDDLLTNMFSLKECSINTKDVDPYNRINLEELFTLTIDPKGSKDLDDALSITDDKLYIHIADVTSYLCESDIDNILKRGNTFYLRNSNIPLISREYSDNIISLLPGKCKRAITLEFDVNNTLVSWYPSLIRNNHQLSYEDVDSILNLETSNYEENIVKNVIKLKDYYNKIKRLDRIDINYSSLSHKMIEEFMINANKSIANILNNTIYRHHDVPYSNKAGYIQRFIGYQLNKRISVNINDLKNNMINLPQKKTLYYLTKHMMSKAIYTDKEKSHWALNEDFYTHFTSPIRRASDIIVHYDLLRGTSYLNKKNDYLSYLNNAEDIQTNIEFILLELDKRRNIRSNFHYKSCIVKINKKGVDCYIPEIDNTYTFHISQCSKGEYLEYIDGELKSNNYHYFLGKCIMLYLKSFNQNTGKYEFVITSEPISNKDV